MKILITTWSLAHFTGAELHARDLGLALQRQGHQVAIYAVFGGRLAELTVAAGLPVVTSLADLTFLPDIIHGHHQPALLDALLRFPATPAVFVVHDAGAARDAPFIVPQIRRYVAVDRRCYVRFADLIPAAQCRMIFNFVDLDRFRPRPRLSDKPARALVFSSYATQETHLPAVLEACGRVSLPVDVIGRGVNKLMENPETILGQYDLLFAKARCAIEAMAVGAAVVLCDFRGLGPMVTAANFDALRPMNFGAGTLTLPLEPVLIAEQIARYDPEDAASVCRRIREDAGLDRAASEFLTLYREILTDPTTAPAIDGRNDAALRQLNAQWRRERRREASIALMRRVRRVPILGPAAYQAWRTGQRAIRGMLH